MKIDKRLLGYLGMAIVCLSITFMNNYLILGVIIGIFLIFYGFKK